MLDKYRSKRNFEVTAEPAGDEKDGGATVRPAHPTPDSTAGPAPAGRATPANALNFVIQKHSARRLHYDLRLEAEGALKSWAVPKGPSLRTTDKHLAVHVEDHPLSYATFEGVIPKGEYGGGEIIVWDRGIYAAMTEKKDVVWDRETSDRMVIEGIKAGKVKFWLEGEKLRGGWMLIKTKRAENEWLMIKEQDEGVADRDVLADETSVISGRTNEDLRKRPTSKPVTLPTTAVEAKMPTDILPMKLTEAEKAFSSPAWSFELKLDGVRALVFMVDGKARLISRNGHNIAHKFPAVAEELEAIAPKNCILDGEIVAFDANGKPSFQSLMHRYHIVGDAEIRAWDRRLPVNLVIFDVLYLDRFDLRKCPFKDRRRVLEDLEIKGRHTKTVDVFPEIGEILYDQARALGLEGVVGKKLDSPYRTGERSTSWLKIKGSHTDEFIVGGYTEGQNSRASTFGALLLGRYVDGKLEYCGSVGGGFSDSDLSEWRDRLTAMQVKESPFTNKIDPKVGKPTFVRPELWVEVRFQNWTDEQRLRMPSYLRVREDLREPSPATRGRAGWGEPETPSEPQIQIEPTKDSPHPHPNPPPQSRGGSSNLLTQIEQAKDESHLEVQGHTFKVSSLKKILWPESEISRAITKRDYLTYLAKVADPFLKALKDRPLSLVRYPNGIAGEGFFQKHVEKGTPEFVEKIRLWSSHNGRAVEYLMCNNLPTLLWMGQNAVLEIHPFYSRVVGGPDAPDAKTEFATSEDTLDDSILNYPDFLVIDLDPNLRSGNEKEGADPELNRKAWEMGVKVAKRVREILLSIGLKAFLKTSGKSGLHLYVPIAREYDYDTVRLVAETLGKHVMRDMPKEVTMVWQVKKRPELIFFDHNQNVRGKTLVSAYSTRAIPGATVSMPLRWDDLDRIYPTDFTILTVPDLLSKAPDPWSDILSVRQRIA